MIHNSTIIKISSACDQILTKKNLTKNEHSLKLTVEDNKIYDKTFYEKTYVANNETDFTLNDTLNTIINSQINILESVQNKFRTIRNMNSTINYSFSLIKQLDKPYILKLQELIENRLENIFLNENYSNKNYSNENYEKNSQTIKDLNKLRDTYIKMNKI